MRNNQPTMSLPTAIVVLADHLQEVAPETKAEATKLSKRPAAALAVLSDWAQELVGALDDAGNTVASAAEADAEDREEFHGTAQEDVETVLTVLARFGLGRPQAGV